MTDALIFHCRLLLCDYVLVVILRVDGCELY